MTQLKRIAGIAALVLAVTVGGVMAGAFLVSPLAATMPWVLPTIAAVSLVAVLAMLREWLWPAVERTTVRLTTSLPAVARPSIGRPSLAARAVDRTPRNVQALAAAGTTLTEIARRTRLPVDAVSMLLSISANGRQLQPPTA